MRSVLKQSGFLFVCLLFSPFYENWLTTKTLLQIAHQESTGERPALTKPSNPSQGRCPIVTACQSPHAVSKARRSLSRRGLWKLPLQQARGACGKQHGDHRGLMGRWWEVGLSEISQLWQHQLLPLRGLPVDSQKTAPSRWSLGAQNLQKSVSNLCWLSTCWLLNNEPNSKSFMILVCPTIPWKQTFGIC